MSSVSKKTNKKNDEMSRGVRSDTGSSLDNIMAINRKFFHL